jgi:hypothetical protein
VREESPAFTRGFFACRPSINELGNGNAPGSPLPADEAAPIDLF